jgi:hypothetical protein
LRAAASAQEENVMNRSLSRHTFTLLLLLLPFAAVAAGAAQGGGVPPTYSNRYEIRFLDLHAAELLAWNQCSSQEPQESQERCRVTILQTSGEGDNPSRTYLEVEADAEVHKRIVEALAKADAAPRTRTFQLVMLLADSKPEGSAPKLPEGAQKALRDIRDLLPFKSYHVLDTAWLRTTRAAEGRLVGLRDQGYEVSLRFRNVGSVEGQSLYVDSFDVMEDPRIPIVDANGKGRPARRLIHTSFGLEVGETIVVGTSKLDGGEQGIVLLLTAVS